MKLVRLTADKDYKNTKCEVVEELPGLVGVDIKPLGSQLRRSG